MDSVIKIYLEEVKIFDPLEELLTYVVHPHHTHVQVSYIVHASIMQLCQFHLILLNFIYNAT